MRQCIFLTPALLKRLEQACRDRYQKKSQIIQMALMRFLDEVQPQQHHVTAQKAKQNQLELV
jgi:hypothetical protein